MNTSRPRTAWVSSALSIVLALLVILPIVVLLSDAVGTYSRVALPPSSLLSRLTGNSIGLAVGAALVATLIGGAQALLLTQRAGWVLRVWRVIVVLPLAIPPYIVAMCTSALLRPRGLAERWLVEAGLSTWGSLPFAAFYGLPGGVIVLGCALAPMVYLPVAAALERRSSTIDDAARVYGLGHFTAFVRLTLPVVVPAAAGAAALVACYAIGEYGVPALFRIPTLSTAIYSRYGGSADRSGAALLSIPLIIGAAFLLQIADRGAPRTTDRTPADWRPFPWRAGGSRAIHGVLVMGSMVPLLLPLSVLAYFLQLPDRHGFGTVDSQRLVAAAFQSLGLALATATLATLASLAPALALRTGGRIGRFAARLCQYGNATPGIVVALAVVVATHTVAPWARAGVFPLLLALVLRTLPQSTTTTANALLPVAHRYHDVAQTLAMTPWQILTRVVLPVARPGVIAGWVLAAITTLKELPATMLLHPAGSDTLAVRIWMPAADGLYAAAALPAFVLVLLALVPLAVVTWYAPTTEAPRA